MSGQGIGDGPDDPMGPAASGGLHGRTHPGGRPLPAAPRLRVEGSQTPIANAAWSNSSGFT